MKENAPASYQPTKGAYQTDHTVNDTSTAAQRQRLLEWMIHNRSVNTHYARDCLNIMAPAARIKELRDQGHDIHTDRIVINDRDGRSHPRVARYVLLQLAEDYQR